MANLDLIDKASSIVMPKKNGEYSVGKVGAALLTENEFMRQIDYENFESHAILEKDRTIKLKELLPY